MKTLKHPTLRAALGVLVLFAMWQGVILGAGWETGAGGLHASVLLLMVVTAMVGTLYRRVRSEDSAVRDEADQCRARGARSRADAALLEADQLLARVSGQGGIGLRHDPVGQLGLVQAELMQMQNRAADPAAAARIEMLRTRLELVAKAVRRTARTVEAG
ncbi:MAG: hypothetical protein EOO78_08590 [Oxalobacteraceae bacterium]|nr:MAG: hypothetical protein EOO78_08590 [Oxalobacteraceae bacterium]